MNKFLSCGTDNLPALPVFNADCPGLVAPYRSQIAGLIFLPNGADTFDWTDAEDVADKTNNEATANNSGRFVVGIGGMTSEPTVITLGRAKQLDAFRRYELVHTVPIGNCAATFNFLSSLQKGWVGFKVWAYTVADRLIGGSTGIMPDYVSVSMPVGPGRNDYETATITIRFRADGDPGRRLLPGLFSGTQPTTLTNMAVATQVYNNQVGNVLTWTENAGAIPTPYKSVLGFCNGQLMNHALSDFTITPGTGSSTITINPALHIDGNNYIFHAFITS